MAIKENLPLTPPSTSADSGSLEVNDAWGSRGSLGAEESSASTPRSVRKGIWRQSAFLQYSLETAKKSETDPKTKHHLQYMSVPTCVPNSLLKTHVYSFLKK